ncbi:hypothetical protein ACHAW6_013070, partial [Cyclotella cf. meneghiniana]
NEYDLHAKANHNNIIFVKVVKGIYSLLQAGLCAQELLKKRLNKHSYFQSKLIPGLWKNETRPIQFVFTVHDFGIKYISKEHANHSSLYSITITRSPLIGPATVTSVSTCSGTIPTTKSIFTCLPTSKRLSSNFNTTAPRNKANLSLTLPSNMMPKNNTPNNNQPCPSLMPKAPFIQKVCEKFLFLVAQLMTLFSCPSASLPPRLLLQHRHL